MYFKDFPQFLYDFNYGNGVTKTTVVRDITRNVRFRKEVLQNISMFDEYDVIDGETPEIIAEKFYGSPEYHWVVMLANQKYDWSSDWPLREDILQKHIKSSYNPKLYSDDWFWDTHDDGIRYIHVKINGGSDTPFEIAFLTAPVKITLYDETKQFVKIINFPTDEIGLDEGTQYFVFPYNEPWDITQFGTGDSANGVGSIRIYVETEGREHNPVMFVSPSGVTIDPKDNPYAIPVTGDELHRAENNQKRRIRLVSPKVLETVIKNYEELLR
jgi:hypothetical protein